MTEPSGHQSWWQTLPGMLTAIAALVTAIGGIFALLFQYGAIGGNEGADQIQQQPAPVTDSQDTTTGASTQPDVGAPPAGTWEKAAVVFTLNDGSALTGRAPTVRYCISAGESVTLSTGQDVAFDKIRSLVITRSDGQFVPSGQADVVITLIGGSKLRGAIGSNCDFFAVNDGGRFSAYPDRLSRIDFQR